MVLLLFTDDFADGPDGGWIDGLKLLNLVLEVTQDHTLDGNRCGCDGAATKERCKKAKRKAPNPTEVVATATPNAALLKLGLKYGAMPPFVRLKLGELSQKTTSSEASNQQLTGVDVYRAMFSGVVDFEDSFAETFSRTKACAQLHEA